jgi:hypothetical protein
MRQKALALLSQFSYIGCPIKITQCGHASRGQVGALRDLFWHRDEPWGVVQFPSGTRFAVPLAWTDMPNEAVPGQKTSPQVDVQSLLKMAHFCQELRPPKKTRRRTAAKAKAKAKAK